MATDDAKAADSASSWTPEDGARFSRSRTAQAFVAEMLRRRGDVRGFLAGRIGYPLPSARDAERCVEDFGLGNDLEPHLARWALAAAGEALVEIGLALSELRSDTARRRARMSRRMVQIEAAARHVFESIDGLPLSAEERLERLRAALYGSEPSGR